MIISDKKQVQQLTALLCAKKIEDIVISPGSRNGPLIHTLVGSGIFNCRNIVDERSAAYFALGIALAKNKPVALVCSSGTATLNYAPAIAEAFYQNIPLIVLTADRPEYWIGQAESQCIQQKGIYRNFTKKEISLPLGESEKELWFAARQINECLNLAVSGTPAPVHINIPIEEPLHNLVEKGLPGVKTIHLAGTRPGLTISELEESAATFNKSEKVLILAGQHKPTQELEKVLRELVEITGTVVLKEHLANLNNANFCGSVDGIMASILNDVLEDYRPDLLISFGGQFVSKSLKQFLRKNKPAEHWHISLSAEHFDTYQSLTKIINTEATDFFLQIAKKAKSKNTVYLNLWKNKEAELNSLRDQFIFQSPWCDLKVFDQLKNAIPEGSVIHLGNSSPVRYALITEGTKDVEYYGNRGTSGIDGPLSTAVGFASESEKINTTILGDLSFFYDSNALWNKYIGKNLRVIVINNRGGNIFGLIKGPGESPAFQEHFFAENNVKAEGVAKTFGLDYFKAENTNELQNSLKKFYSAEQQCPALLEIFTDAEVNTQTFRGFFKFVKQ